MELKLQLSAITREKFGCEPACCTDAQLYHALLALTQQLCAGRPAPRGGAQTLLFFGRIPDGQAAEQQPAGPGPV